MRKVLISIFLGMIFIAASALNAHAQMCECMGGDGGMMGMGHQGMGMMQGMEGMHGGMMGGEHGMWKQLMSLGLDEKQTAALKALHNRTMKDMIRKTAEKQVAELELKDLMDRDQVDMKAVEAMVKKIESLETEMKLAHIRAHEEMKATLTPEQRKKLKEMKAGGHGPGCSMMGGMKHDDEKKDMPMHMQH